MELTVSLQDTSAWSQGLEERERPFTGERPMDAWVHGPGLTCCVVLVVLDQFGDGGEQVLLSQVEVGGAALGLLDVVMFDPPTPLPSEKHHM